jgi:ribonuclease HI
MISHSEDILLAELTTIYHGLRMAVDMGIDDLACYSDSLLSINLIKGDIPHYHVYAVLIQNIKDILATNNFTVYHTLREGNQSADFMAKLGAASNADFVIHTAPPEDLLLLLRSDASGVFFPRA